MLRIERRLLLLGENRPSTPEIVLGNARTFLRNLHALIRPRTALKRLFVQNETELLEILQQDSLIFVGAHQGLFELLPHYLRECGKEVEIPYRHQGLQILWNRWFRQKPGIHTLPHSQVPKALRRWAKNPSTLACLCDQGPGPLAPLLGDPCPLALSLPLHLRHHGWNVIFFRILETKGYYELQWQELDFGDSLHLGFAQFLEEGIRRAPEQWVWHYPLHFPLQPQYLRSQA